MCSSLASSRFPSLSNKNYIDHFDTVEEPIDPVNSLLHQDFTKEQYDDLVSRSSFNFTTCKNIHIGSDSKMFMNSA